MKTISCIIIAIMTYNLGLSQQNLVPNGGFDLHPELYNGGSNPVNYYTANLNCSEGTTRFEADVTDWFVAESNAPNSELQTPGVRKCSPDWIAPWALDSDAECQVNHTSFFVSSAFNAESIMVKMAKDGSEYFLVKGRTYKFRAKVRTGKGNGSFQVVFSTKDKGLNVSNNKRWVALDIYVDFSGCEWRNVEYYFTVPNDNNKKYDEMKYIVLQYNNDITNNDFAIHYDDIVLIEEEPCVDYKYIQNWQYYDLHKIEQANVQISAGANVSPDLSENTGPVIVKSGAMVIYRAPTIEIDTATFIVEEGAYFETQTGTCVEDPCPTLPSYTAPSFAFCGPVTLGTDLPAEIPGIFYAWEPAEYFSAPWSRITDFVPPAGVGCIDAKLIIWSICGPSQSYEFPVKYYENAPEVSIANVQNSPTQFGFTANFDNTQNYTLVVTNSGTGEVLHEETVMTSCEENDGVKNFVFKACDFGLCGNKEIKIIAENACFEPAEATVMIQSPPAVSPSLNISNVQHSDFSFSFDVAVNANTEFVTVELWNEDLTVLECTKTFRSCDIPFGQASVHWDNTLCQTGCISICGNHALKVKYKNVCSGQVLEEMLYWNKTTNNIQVSDWPNIVTNNGDGINDALCLDVSGADFFEITVVDRWGVTRYHDTGCVNTDPVCVWTPSDYLPDDNYFYTLTFTNHCGSPAVENTTFIQIYHPFGFKNGATDTTSTDGDYTDLSVINRHGETEGIQVFPNPVNDYLYIRSADKVQQAKVMDLNGKIVINSAVSNRINCSSLVPGAYFVEVRTVKGNERFKFIKL